MVTAEKSADRRVCQAWCVAERPPYLPCDGGDGDGEGTKDRALPRDDAVPILAKVSVRLDGVSGRPGEVSPSELPILGTG